MANLDQHPCFSQNCQTASGRIHLPVAPRCNIFCRFCSRGISAKTARPGQTAQILSPQKALDIIDLALTLCPELKVAGVAGPGDPLAGPEALDTLILLKKYYPQLIACLSTNGLALSESMEKILSAGVETITVTVNALDPVILETINRGVLIDGQFVGGLLGAQRLIGAQEEGLKLAHKNHLVIKVNTVLIPGLNDRHLPEIAQTVSQWGADLFNIIPLIPAHELKHYPAPTQEEINSAAQRAEKYLPVKRNCRRCRADACGIPGGIDYSQMLYGNLEITETFSHG